MIVLSSPSAFAQLTYDANTGIAGAQDGAGLGWNTSEANFWDGAANVAWTNGTSDTAIFGAGGTLANAAAGTVTVGTVNAGTIRFNGTVTTGYTLATGAITLGTGIENNNAGLNSIISAKISGTNGLAYSGTGTAGVNLSNTTNDYTGITTLTGGTARIGVNSNSALGSSAGASASTLGTNYTEVAVGNGVNFNGDGRTVSEAFIINGSGTGTGSGAFGALRMVNSNVTLNSLIRLGSNSLIEGAFSTNASINGNVELQSFTLSTQDHSGAINGVISGSGGVTILNNSTYNLTNTANSFSGSLTLSGGTAVLGLGSNGVLGTSTVVFNGGTIRSTDATARTITNAIGTFLGGATFGATTVQTGALNFTNTTEVSLGAASKTLTTNVATRFANGFSGAGGIVKAGAATLTLEGTSSYGGTTEVNAGTLLVNGTNSGSGAVNVGASGTLGGTGTIVGGINVTGILSPGASIESFATGSVAFLTGSRMVYELQDSSATGADLLAITGDLSLAGTVTLDLVKLGVASWSIGDKLTLISYTGSITANSFFNFADGNDGKLLDDEVFDFDGAQWQFNYDDLTEGSNYTADASGKFVTMTVIPEPSAALLGALGTLALLRRRRI